MVTKSGPETIKVKGSELVEQFKRLVHEGNVRRIIIKHEDHTIADFPLTVGVVAAVFAPMLAAVAAVAALVTECTIEVERTDTPPGPDGDGDTEL